MTFGIDKLTINVFYRNIESTLKSPCRTN